MKRIAYKYRIYPNTEQKVFFAKCFGCVRFFYNKSLDDINEIYKTAGKFKNITPASYKDEYPFLKEVDSLALCNAQINRNTAFKAFFSHKSGFPKFKSKRNNQSYTTNNQGSVKLSTNNRYISIPKCPRIRIKKHRDFIGTIKSITVSMTTDNKYYMSLLVEEENKPMEPTDGMIGLDLGIKDLIVDSNGHKYKNHKYLTKSQNKLVKEQNIIDKRFFGLGKLIDRILNRKDYLLRKERIKAIQKDIDGEQKSLDYFAQNGRSMFDKKIIEAFKSWENNNQQKSMEKKKIVDLSLTIKKSHEREGNIR